jgi:hypothetical protein
MLAREWKGYAVQPNTPSLIGIVRALFSWAWRTIGAAGVTNAAV